MAIRVGVAFMVLILVNVGIGLWFIFRHESNNPNRPLLEAQMRQQIAKSIERAAALTPAPNVLGVPKSQSQPSTGKMDSVANEVVAIAGRLGGSATKGLQDSNRLSVLVDVPPNRNKNFALKWRPLPRKGRGHPPSLKLRRRGRLRLQKRRQLQARRRASLSRSWKSSESD